MTLKSLFRIKILFALLLFPFLATTDKQAKAIEINKNAIPLLRILGSDGKEITTATGFVIKPEGVLVTAYHILIDAYNVKAIFPSGHVVDAEGIYKVDRQKDYAILQLTSGLYSTLETSSSKTLRGFDYSSALGYPSEEMRTSSKDGPLRQAYGMILGTHPRANPNFKVAYITIPLKPGFSGGPVVDRSNKVIGVSILDSRTTNVALPIKEILPVPEKGALLSFQDLLRQDTLSSDTLYYKGTFQLNQRDNPELALDYFSKALEANPNCANCLYDSAVAYRNMGNTEKAIDAYRKTLNIYPKFPEALSNLGSQVFRAGKMEEAAKLFQRAIESFPNFVTALSNLGAVLIKLNRFQKALPALQKTVQLSPEFAIAYFNLGNAQFGMQRWDLARTSFEKAANLGLDFLSLHWKLYEIHSLEKRWPMALRELEHILRIEPENHDARKLLNQITGRD